LDASTKAGRHGPGRTAGKPAELFLDHIGNAELAHRSDRIGGARVGHFAEIVGRARSENIVAELGLPHRGHQLPPPAAAGVGDTVGDMEEMGVVI
jgi:hypothetical protein